MEQIGRPLLPFQRARREAYNYQKQLPSDHIKILDHYLSIASHLVPKDPALSHFHIRHPNLWPGNIIVSRSPDSNLHVAGVIDWQHISILPLFLLTGSPQQLRNYEDFDWQYMTRPLLPESLDLDETQQNEVMESFRRCLVHFL